MATDDERPTQASAPGGGTAYGGAAAFRPAKKEPLLVRTVPVLKDVPRYRRSSAGRDLVAGLTVAALALPSAMAYGQLAGLSPVNGLYALLLPTVAYVLLGSSRRLVIGPGGRDLDPRRRGGSPARGRGQRRRGRARVDARAARRRLLPARVGCCGSAGSPTTSPGPC